MYLKGVRGSYRFALWVDKGRMFLCAQVHLAFNSIYLLISSSPFNNIAVLHSSISHLGVEVAPQIPID